jgi:hypothetical protein
MLYDDGGDARFGNVAGCAGRVNLRSLGMLCDGVILGDLYTCVCVCVCTTLDEDGARGETRDAR